MVVLVLGFAFCLAASQFLAAAVAELRDWLMVCFFVAMLLAPAAAAAAGEDPAAVFRTQDAEVGGLQALADKEWIAGS